VAPRRIFRFGLFEADVESGELRKNGQKLRLQEQPFQILVLLLERAGEVVTREHVQRRLWPADTFVDFEHGVNTAVNKLRDALGDSAANPRFIETLAKRGYRFIAPVDTGAAEPQLVPAPNPQAKPAAGNSWALPSTLLTQPHEVPTAPRAVVRILFLLIQVMYLSIYVVSLAKLGRVHVLIGEMVAHTTWAVVLLIVTAAVGIPTRLYLISAVGFDYRGLGAKFQKLFVFLFPLDEVWALAPFLLMHQIGFGLALAATAALLYLPFAQRSLLLMGYPNRQS
jgi:DNA-binding winged helix-turn-helix (wHTH) protein